MTEILFYNDFFGRSPKLGVLSTAERSAYTQDLGRLGQADAVIFHLPSLQRPPPSTKPARQLWIAWSMESQANVPLMNHSGFMSLFDATMSYRRGADIWTPYLPHRQALLGPGIKAPSEKRETAPAVAFISSAVDHSGRRDLLKGLMRTMRVDSYGAVLRTRELQGADEGRQTKLDVIGRYRFCLAFENAIEEDYVTEKFFDPLVAGAIPVYLGAPNVEAFAPADDCFINAADFPTPGALARHLIDVAYRPAACATLMAWRSRPLRPAFEAALEAVATPVFSRVLRWVEARASGLNGDIPLG